MDKKAKIVFGILCVVVAFMDISGLPAVLLKLSVADVDSFILPLMLNFVLIGIIAFLVIKCFRIIYPLGFTTDGLWKGLKHYALPGILAGIASFFAFYIGLYPFDYKPTITKILLEGILYYVGVGIVEEFYVRGLLLTRINRKSFAFPPHF